MKKLNILIWHIHGSYLNCLVQAQHTFYLPVKEGRPEGYGGRGPTFVWPDNAIEVPVAQVKDLELDLVVFQTPKNYFEDQNEILSEQQRRLPKLYLEHNTPKGHPTDTPHPVDDPAVMLVHVTHFNRMMWDSGRCRTRVIEHTAIPRPGLEWNGDLPRGIVVVNGLKRRNRVAGYDVWEMLKDRVPLDLVGMQTEEIGGLGDFPQADLLAKEANYRFFFNPIRYTSLPLSVIEAMMLGLPVVALATTELPTVIVDGVNGYVSNDLDYLVDRMKRLIDDKQEAQRLGANARAAAQRRFGLERFIRDWDAAFRETVGNTETPRFGEG